MLIALLNKSSRYSKNGKLLTQMASAVNQQLIKHVSPVWNINGWSCVYFNNEADVPTGAYKLWILDDSDQADALGYHDQDIDGVPYGRVFVNPIISSGGTDFSSANSVSVTISHEACEMMCDPEVNCWRHMSDGTLTCQEICDAVEGDAYPILISGKKVYVSNFLFPAWFDYAPQKESKFDYMKKLKSNFSMTKNGYMIIIRDGQIDYLFASKDTEKKYFSSKSKQHIAARGMKRKGIININTNSNAVYESVDQSAVKNDETVEFKPKIDISKLDTTKIRSRTNISK